MPKYRVITTFHEGTDEAKGPGDIVELTEEQAGPFVKTNRLAPYQDPKPLAARESKKQTAPAPSAFVREVEKHKLLPDKPQEPLAPEPNAFAQDDLLSKSEENKLLPDELPGLTVKQLIALPEWEQVPDPKPTKKADILTAIRKVRGA